ncbi:BQ2448_7777 [Microbotryum intermedium]|uniref:BQ2448_7777 protein n=1 Tax=Microbotryum intermedium TaxID=269621 RepID=A0A238FU46_9BASI|nr:BQ2448_7777 [Microbotryum intermedium]
MSKPTTTTATRTSSFPTFLDLPRSTHTSSQPLPDHSSISLLPFSITYSGPTDISTQFPIRASAPTKRCDGTLEQHQEAAFRGRLLISTKVELPKGYKGWVVESRKPAPPPPTATTTVATLGKLGRTGEGFEHRVAQKAKIEGGGTGSTGLMRGGKVLQRGTRTSPRKKKVVVRYSLDSDEEREREREQAVGDQVVDQVMKNVEEEMNGSRTEGEDSTMSDTAQDLMESFSTITTSTTPATNPSTAVSLSTSFSSIPDTPKEPEHEPESENLAEAPLARDEIHLIPVSLFSSIDLWNPDSAADMATDVYARALREWTGVAAKVRELEPLKEEGFLQGGWVLARQPRMRRADLSMELVL